MEAHYGWFISIRFGAQFDVNHVSLFFSPLTYTVPMIQTPVRHVN